MIKKGDPVKVLQKYTLSVNLIYFLMRDMTGLLFSAFILSGMATIITAIMWIWRAFV